MSERFRQITFTPSVLEAQQIYLGGSAEVPLDAKIAKLSSKEVDFIQARDSFYMASISEAGWPYIQHRGGPTGFLRVLGEQRIGFADYAGNRQLITVGNLAANDRVAPFLIDHDKGERLKILGHARVVDARSEPAIKELLSPPNHRAKVDRLFFIEVEAFDWNCPQHIHPRRKTLPTEPIM